MFTRFFPILTKLKALKTHGRMLWHAFRHADTPKWIKGFMLGVVVYLFSPIDMIPDFLVLFGITDDLVVITAAMWFLGKVVPEKVKNSLPGNSNTDKAPHEPESRAGAKTTGTSKASGTTNKLENTTPKSPLKPFGWVLLGGLLLAALGSHPLVLTQFQHIGSLFQTGM